MTSDDKDSIPPYLRRRFKGSMLNRALEADGDEDEMASILAEVWTAAYRRGYSRANFERNLAPFESSDREDNNG